MPKGITRIKNYKNRADGWLVRLQRRGEKFSEFFKDANYISEDAALRAACRAYNRQVKQHPKITRQENAQRKTARTGKVIGVRRLLKVDNRWQGNTYEVWEARWSHEKYNRQVRTFSIKKYGEAEAKRLALEARKAGLLEMGEN